MTTDGTKQLGTWVMTGAAGRIGRHLRSSLGASFSQLIVTDVVPINDAAHNEIAHQLDLGDIDGLRTLLEGVEGVIHLGGLADEADFRDLVEANVIGTYHVLEAARVNGVRRILYASSNRLTGFYPTTHHTTASDPFRPDGLYGATKAATEVLCSLYVDKFGLSIASIRIGSFETHPSTPRELSTWLSPDDCTAAFTAALTSSYDRATFYAVSANSSRWWSLGEGHALGYWPRDDAEDYRASIPGTAREPQGGDLATQDFTLSRQAHARRWNAHG